MSNTRKKILFLAQFSMLLAIEAIVSFTPLGSLPAFGPIVSTLFMIPVIITAILLGTGPGAAMGAFAGLFSLLVWTFTPPSPIAFVFSPFYSLGVMHGNFWSLIIVFVPRILVGVVTGVCFNWLSRSPEDKKRNDIVVYSISAALGSLTNTLLVLGGIYVFFGRSYAETAGVAYNLLLGIIGMTILTSGIPEAILGAVAAYAICRPVKKFLLNRQ